MDCGVGGRVLDWGLFWLGMLQRSIGKCTIWGCKAYGVGHKARPSGSWQQKTINHKTQRTRRKDRTTKSTKGTKKRQSSHRERRELRG